jgi:hypothetical protein
MCKWSVYLDKGIWVSMWRLFKYDKMIRGENERMCSIYNRTICYTYTCNKTTHILLTSCTCNINIKSHLYWIYTHNEYTSNRFIISLYELFPLNTGKNVPFHAKFNIHLYILHNLHKILML